jgi:Co/Zn/Cd efflux system component
MSTTENALTAHLFVPDPQVREPALKAARKVLEAQFHLYHVTIQVEGEPEQDCIDC